MRLTEAARRRFSYKKNVPATNRGNAQHVIYESIYYRNYLRRRRAATNANAPKPANIPNADGSGMTVVVLT